MASGNAEQWYQAEHPPIISRELWTASTRSLRRMAARQQFCFAVPSSLKASCLATTARVAGTRPRRMVVATATTCPQRDVEHAGARACRCDRRLLNSNGGARPTAPPSQCPESARRHAATGDRSIRPWMKPDHRGGYDPARRDLGSTVFRRSRPDREGCGESHRVTLTTSK